jgi:hypothetical protein
LTSEAHDAAATSPASAATSANGRRFDAVIFDVGGVLTTSVSTLMTKQLEPHGVTLAGFLPIAMGPLDTDTDHPWHRLEHGEITVAEFTETQSTLAREAGFAPFPSLPDSDVLKQGLQASADMIAFAREVVPPSTSPTTSPPSPNPAPSSLSLLSSPGFGSRAATLA